MVKKCGNEAYKLFFIKGNKLLQVELIDLPALFTPDFEDNLKVWTCNLFKPRSKEREDSLSQADLDEAQIIYSYLKKKNNGIRSVKIPFSRIEELDYAKIKGMLF